MNRTGSNWMQYIPLFLYSFRWKIEVSYYEQKMFRSFCGYMIRSRNGIEMFVNFINISYYVTKMPLYLKISKVFFMLSMNYVIFDTRREAPEMGNLSGLR